MNERLAETKCVWRWIEPCA